MSMCIDTPENVMNLCKVNETAQRVAAEVVEKKMVHTPSFNDVNELIDITYSDHMHQMGIWFLIGCAVFTVLILLTGWYLQNVWRHERQILVGASNYFRDREAARRAPAQAKPSLTPAKELIKRRLLSTTTPDHRNYMVEVIVNDNDEFFTLPFTKDNVDNVIDTIYNYAVANNLNFVTAIKYQVRKLS